MKRLKTVEIKPRNSYSQSSRWPDDHHIDLVPYFSFFFHHLFSPCIWIFLVSLLMNCYRIQFYNDRFLPAYAWEESDEKETFETCLVSNWTTRIESECSKAGLVAQACNASSWRPTLVDVHALDKVYPQLGMFAGDRCKVVLQRTVAINHRNPWADRERQKSRKGGYLPMLEDLSWKVVGSNPLRQGTSISFTKVGSSPENLFFCSARLEVEHPEGRDRVGWEKTWKWKLRKRLQR